MNTILRRCMSVLVAAVGWLPGANGVLAEEPRADVVVTRSARGFDQLGENLLKPDAWRAYEQGFEREEGAWVCDNGADRGARRGVVQTIRLDQTRPEPIVAVAWSKAEEVTGSPGADYSLYLDLVYEDGTPLWGQSAAFDVGTHDWQKRRVLVLPEKPVRSVSMYLLLRGHGGKVWFRDAELRVVRAAEGACVFDGVAVVPKGPPVEGFQVRDVAAGGDFVGIDREALGLKLDWKQTEDRFGAKWFDAVLSDTTGKDRAVTLYYTVPMRREMVRPEPVLENRPFEHVRYPLAWLDDPRRKTEVVAGREYVAAGRFRVGANGRLSHYPFGAVADRYNGVALGIDMAHPAFFRVGYNAATEELFLAYDVGLTPEKPSARVRFCSFGFEPAWGFRAALARYYELFPEAFRRRVAEQGLWMPFAKISEVKGWEDFGFRIKEGDNETAWDDDHGMLTFRYTEPMTWWMRMPKDMPRTYEAALAEARRLAEQGNPQAKALLASGYQDESGRFSARLLDTPWCDGAVWSLNSMPGVEGETTDFKNKWNARLKEKLYGPGRAGELDGEYVDSSEGYVTDELNFRRDHFAAAETPLTFSPDSHKPAVFRGLVAFEYVRAIARDVHPMNKLMMANGAPTRLCWLAPMVDVLGTETDWHRGGRWQPMSDADMLYRRAMSKGKPYCFLMNTRFEDFGPELVEKYMKRSLAYGMFPGFFSHNASQGHYFTRPDLYDRDRPLFKKYVPLCKLVSEAGWEPVTLARSSDDRVYVERFGARYLTVFNDSAETRTATIALDGLAPAGDASRELLGGREVAWREGKAAITLAAEDVALLDLGAPSEAAR